MDSKISNLTELTDAPAVTDELVIVDKSDTTQSASGTTKRVIAQNLFSKYVPNATEKTTPADADLVGLFDSASSFVLKKLTWANVKAGLLSYFQSVFSILAKDSDGWQVADAMTYVSATSFSVTGDKTAKYTKGTKIKLTNSTVKYFYVLSSSYSDGTELTTVTVTGETDLESGAITSPYYSYADNPQGFKGSNYFLARAKRTTTQTINDNSYTKVQLNSEDYDINSNFDSTSNYRYTAPINGFYNVNCFVFAYDAQNKIGVFRTLLYKNGVGIITNGSTPSTDYTGVIFSGLISVNIYLSKGDYIELYVYGDTTDSGSFAIGTSSSEPSYLDVRFLSV